MSDKLIRRIAEYLAHRDQVFAVGADLSEYEEIARDIAAIVAERGAGTTGEPALTPEDEEFIGSIRAGATMRKIWEENPLEGATAAIDTTGADLLVVGDQMFKRAEGGVWVGIEKPAPAPACHNDRPGDPCPCGANFERCPPAGTPLDGVAIVGGEVACARCGGSGTMTFGETLKADQHGVRRWVPNWRPCPDCGGKP